MKIGKARCEVVYGDITGIDVEAIVNPANDMLWFGGGVSAVIRKKGGETIETESMTKAPAEIGSAVITCAGALKARCVIHAVISGQDLITNERYIRSAVRASLAKANDKKYLSIAIPLLNTGTTNLEIHSEARSIVDETVNFLINENKTITRVVFVESDKSIKGIFTEALQGKFTKHVT